MSVYIVNEIVSGNTLEIINVQTRELIEIHEPNARDYRVGEQVAVANGCIVS